MKAQSNKIFATTAILLALCLCNFLQAQSINIGIGFYNLENLFDTVDDSLTQDEEFTPNGSKHWTEKLYQDKIGRLSNVIYQLSAEEKSSSLALLGVCEIENRKVLEDLIQSEKLKDFYFKIVHHNSPDLRGVDVALIYQPKYFTVLQSQSIRISLFEKDSTPRLTRDVLMVKGKIGNELLFVFVNHWPSRRGGEESKAFRLIAAKRVKHFADSIALQNPEGKIIIMGDLNDNPDDESLTKVILAKPNPKGLKTTEFYNPYYKNYKNGEGTTPFDDAWNLFDQILLSKNLISKNLNTDLHYQYHKIFKKSFMMEKYGHFKNHPKRTFSGDRYNYGYSDHFPVICYFKIQN